MPSADPCLANPSLCLLRLALFTGSPHSSTPDHEPCMPVVDPGTRSATRNAPCGRPYRAHAQRCPHVGDPCTARRHHESPQGASKPNAHHSV